MVFPVEVLVFDFDEFSEEQVSITRPLKKLLQIEYLCQTNRFRASIALSFILSSSNKTSKSSNTNL
jgi:hypothetical protein